VDASSLGEVASDSVVEPAVVSPSVASDPPELSSEPEQADSASTATSEATAADGRVRERRIPTPYGRSAPPARPATPFSVTPV
jgi:hypothetical protein